MDRGKPLHRLAVGWGCVTPLPLTVPHLLTVPPPLPRQHPGISPAGVAASATTSAV